jgi:hypothetical protein
MVKYETYKKSLNIKTEEGLNTERIISPGLSASFLFLYGA